MPPKFDISFLPIEWQDNWLLLQTLRQDASYAYAYSVAGDPKPTPEWLSAFTEALIAWIRVNPFADYWITGSWPAGASVYLGNDVLEQARQMIRQHAAGDA